MSKTEIYSDKKKAFLFLCISIVFVVLGVWCILEAENITSPLFRNSLIIKIAGMASVLLFGFVMYVTSKQLFRNKLMLILDENGINLNPSKDKFIKWKDVEGFSEIKINSVKIIIIHINNAEEYLNNETNKIRIKLMNYNLNNYGSPFTITVSTMNISHKELHQLLNENLMKYK